MNQYKFSHVFSSWDFSQDTHYNFDTLVCLIHNIDDFLLNLLLFVLFTLSIQSLLNRSELIPDWKVKERDNDEGTIAKLREQWRYNQEKRFIKDKLDIFSTAFPISAVLTLKDRIRIRLWSQTWKYCYINRSVLPRYPELGNVKRSVHANVVLWYMGEITATEAGLPYCVGRAI